MQQDAQEFTLMFLAALERYLPTHPNGKPVLDFLKQRFFVSSYDFFHVFIVGKN